MGTNKSQTAPPLSKERIESLEMEMDSLGLREIYDALIANGNHPNMAAMLAAQQAPKSWNTDSDFCRTEHGRMRSIDDENMEKIVKIAKRAGINTQGKTYNGQLGKYDDPYAWVSSTSDVKEAAINKGLDIDGMVRVNAYRGPKAKPVIAQDILDGLEKRARSKDKLLDERCKTSEKARRELREGLVEKHSSKKKR